jgi:hypothetical protein
MDKDQLSAKEAALLAEARREAQAQKDPPAPATPRPAAEAKPAPAEPRPAPTAAERLAELMEEERSRTLEKKKKMRRYGIIIPGSILAVFALWLLNAFRRRR